MYRSKYLDKIGRRNAADSIETRRREEIGARVPTTSMTKEFVSKASARKATRVYASAACTAASYSSLGPMYTCNSMSGEYSTWDDE